MLLDPLDIERTEWKTKNIMNLFDKALSLFPQLEEQDIVEIKNSIQTDNIGYFEVAHYENKFDEQKDPSAILVINNNRVFYDIVDLDRMPVLIENFKQLISNDLQFVKSRKITKTELRKRVESLIQMNKEQQDFIDLEESGDKDNVEDYGIDGYFDVLKKNEFGHLDRAGIQLIAKKPALDWFNSCLKKEPRKIVRTNDFVWTLEQINKHPNVFLIPIGTELLPKKVALRFWRETKEKIFMAFLEGYYTDENYWPSYAGEAFFDRWFDIKAQGLVIDLVDDEDSEFNVF